MRRLLLLALLAPLAGCAAPAESDAVLPLAAGADAPGGWNATGQHAFGWIAAAGTHAFPGDLIVGVRSHEQCPEADFLVPENVTKLRVDVAAGQGVGAYFVAISSPDAVWYFTAIPGGPFTFETEDATPGVWTLEFKPRGAVAAARWPTTLTLEGSDGEPPAEVAFYPDADCLM